ncbi:MAG TPA: sigma-70 family RNA polymerase sigma factor [Bryobacteraceae bacterium]|nr:sigma-70 family RNA polymerase sigma factor [Bryobacteraceae bacterium]
MADATIRLQLDFHDGLEKSTESAADSALLVENLRAGVEEAYETLLQKYQQPVYNLVYRLLDNPADTSDVVQEVFLKVFRNIGTFRGNSSLKTWVYRIAFNEAYNHRRWFTRHKRQEIGLERDDGDGPSFQEVLPDPGRSAFQIVCDHETRSLIEEALGDLNPVFRAAVVLRDIEELSYEEIAEVLDLNPGTVKSRIMRGRDALRKALAARVHPAAGLNLNPELAR